MLYGLKIYTSQKTNREALKNLNIMEKIIKESFNDTVPFTI